METISISKIFSQNIFRIPDYQRGYSWGQQQLSEFWDDILRMRDNQDHYTGLITLEKVKNFKNTDKWKDVEWIINSAAYKPFYIVDGQQRITTIIILIQAIINKIDNDDKLNLQRKNQIVEKYICIKDKNLKAFIFGYEKDDPSYEFLKANIFNEESSNLLNTSPSLYTKNLNQAKLFFEEKMNSFNIDKLETIFKKITLGLKFNLYEVDNDLDVFVMFETMNNRGKPLSKLELLKNRIIYLSTLLECPENQKIELRNQINNSWRTIYEYLGKKSDIILNDDEFLKNHTYMYFGLMDNQTDTYINYLLNEHFTTSNIYMNSIKLEDIDNYIQSIQKAIVIWLDIKIPSNNITDTDKEIKYWLHKLSRIKSAYFHPIILAMLLYRNENNRPFFITDIVDTLKEMERFSFLSYYIFQRNSNYKKNLFMAKGNEIYHGYTSLFSLINEIKEYSKQENNSIDNFIYHLDRLYDNENKPGFYGWKGLEYFLYEYEEYLAGSDNIKLVWDEIRSNSIEHIYPQNPDENWTEPFKNYSTTQKNYICHSLGNLLLISQKKNSSFQNKEFKIKKEHSDLGYYFGSYSENHVAKYPRWTIQEIYERGCDMLEFMEKRWGVIIGDSKQKVLFLNFIDLERFNTTKNKKGMDTNLRAKSISNNSTYHPYKIIKNCLRKNYSRDKIIDELYMFSDDNSMGWAQNTLLAYEQEYQNEEDI